jgi:hypothetical protein
VFIISLIVLFFCRSGWSGEFERFVCDMKHRGEAINFHIWLSATRADLCLNKIYLVITLLHKSMLHFAARNLFPKSRLCLQFPFHHSVSMRNFHKLCVFDHGTSSLYIL